MDGLYHVRIEPVGGGKATNAGVMVMRDGQILGGDAFFYYVGAYQTSGEGWSGEFVTRQHTRSGDVGPAFGALEVAIDLTCKQNGDALEGIADIRQSGAPSSYRVSLRRVADA